MSQHNQILGNTALYNCEQNKSRQDRYPHCRNSHQISQISCKKSYEWERQTLRRRLISHKIYMCKSCNNYLQHNFFTFFVLDNMQMPILISQYQEQVLELCIVLSCKFARFTHSLLPSYVLLTSYPGPSTRERAWYAKSRG